LRDLNWEKEQKRLGVEYVTQIAFTIQAEGARSAGELGDGLGALGDGVLGELTGEEEADGGLDLAAGEGVALVVADEAGALSGDLLEDVVDEGVHDAHGLLGDAGLGVNLLEDTVDVDGEGLSAAVAAGSSTGSGFSSSGHCV